MLKKPSLLLSSYSNIHGRYYPHSNGINVASPYPQPHQDQFSGRRKRRRQRYATLQSSVPSADSPDSLSWPELASETAIPTPYQIFRIEKDATYSKRRFYELVKLYHPDKNGHESCSSKINGLSGAIKMERYRLVVAANDILSDSAKRSAYDQTGAGWNGRPEHGAPKYTWAQNNETRWYGFDSNDSPFRNATWEDWERWYQRDKAKQEPVYFSNGGFLSLILIAVFLGGFGQSIRVEDHANIFQRQVEMVHDDASKAITKRRTESQNFGNKDERLHNFLKTRDPYAYANTNSTEEDYRKMLPEPETQGSAPKGS